MKNQVKGFSPKPNTSGIDKITRQEEATLRNEFEIMQKLDFMFIKDLGVNSAEEYILEVTTLRYSTRDYGRKQKDV